MALHVYRLGILYSFRDDRSYFQTRNTALALHIFRRRIQPWPFRFSDENDSIVHSDFQTGTTHGAMYMAHQITRRKTQLYMQS